MASQTLGFLNLEDVDSAKTWLRAFRAMSRAQNWKDTDDCRTITDQFISRCGIASLQKVEFIVAPKELEELKFEEINTSILSFLQPKSRIVAAERYKFYQCRQKGNEPITEFVARLRKAAQTCSFDSLKTCSDPSEEMVLMGLVAGINDKAIQSLVIERMSSSVLTVSSVQDIVRNQELVQSFISSSRNQIQDTINSISNENRENSINSIAKNSKVNKIQCRYCGSAHPPRSCPAYGKTCNNCGRQNHFSKACLQKKRVNAVEEVDIGYVNHHVFSINELIENILINGHVVPMQIDTGAGLSLLSSSLWQKIGSPSLSKYKKALESYDGHVMKTIGVFQCEIERKNKFEVVNLVVVQSDKSFGLLGRDNIQSEVVDNVTQSVSHSVILPSIQGFKATVELAADSPPPVLSS